MAAFFKSTVAHFLALDLGTLLLDLTGGTAGLGFDLKADQHASWLKQTAILKCALREIAVHDSTVGAWGLLLEYQIPGRAKRLDAILLDGCGIIAIEFKNGATEFNSGDRWQLRDYCWDLRDFHRESQDIPIAQILVASDAPNPRRNLDCGFEDKERIVFSQFEANEGTFATTLATAHNTLAKLATHKIDLYRWDASQAHTTRSIIEEAQSLFAAHDVREVHHSHADNTTVAQQKLVEIVRKSRAEKLRSICFVTGVPGAGKTLVGLQGAYSPEMVKAAGRAACFASGNRPLLDVLLAALTLNRSSQGGPNREIEHQLSAPMQNVHDFALRNFLDTEQRAPTEQVIVFDEAQRVWTKEKVKKGIEKKVFRKRLTREQANDIFKVPHSEPDLLLRVMERCEDWCVIIALVGGGQEIYDGEAGLGAWGVSLANAATKWTVWVSPQAVEGDASVAGKTLFPDGVPKSLSINKEESLHLSVTKRSPRAEKYAEWVNLVLAGKPVEAAALAPALEGFPIFLTRSLGEARRKLQDFAGEGSRYGIVASSGAMRLRSEGLELKHEFRDSLSYPDWFLRPPGDIRSSNHLEVAATEFECQGLELDWTLVCWGGDLIRSINSQNWIPRSLYTYPKGSPRWRNTTDAEDQQFILNKYRVLLTRARFGTVFFVPRGSEKDQTLNPTELDAIADYLGQCGVGNSVYHFR